MYVRRDPTNNGETGTCLELQRSVRVEWAFMRIEPVAGFGRRLNRRPLRSLVVATNSCSSPGRAGSRPVRRARRCPERGPSGCLGTRLRERRAGQRVSPSRAGLRPQRASDVDGSSPPCCAAHLRRAYGWVVSISIRGCERVRGLFLPLMACCPGSASEGNPARDPRSQNPLASRGIQDTDPGTGNHVPWWEPADCIGPTSRSGSLIIVEGDRLCAG